eukprot:2165623-Karenia_brevis.AAC.1
MLKEMNDRCTQEQIAAFEASLDWVPMIFGDGQENCEKVQRDAYDRWTVVSLQKGKWKAVVDMCRL